ncbi:MAG: hypothetical protein QXO84_03830 [Candidatus Aenigmatarchaeota archaeon]
MEILLKITKNFEENKKRLLSDELVSRGSIIFRDSESIDMEGNFYYCLIEGTEEIIQKVKELTNEDINIIEGKEKKEVIERIKEDEAKAEEGLGFIFR